MSIIRKLDESVINRIAAGEVIQRPSSAVKELIENSIDAGSTMITLTIKGGGLQCIQIQDNGHGIHKDDMLTVCNRFTTSKLSAYEDLKSISTFGFRGEALASITYVSKVTITSKTASAPCAYKAKYSDGEMIPWDAQSAVEPKLCAGLTGTTVVIEDLFYNITIRRKSFQNSNEEYQRILDVVSRYSILYGDKGIFFVCKKHGQSIPDLVTTSSASSKENIGRVFGVHVVKELLPLQGSSKELGITLEGYITNASYSGKSGVFVLFINNRLIECSSIRKVVDGTYHDLFTAQVRPMPPENVDVNVHPTKKEVHFLHEDELLHLIRRIIEPVLTASNQSRTFGAQTSLTHFYSNDNRGGVVVAESVAKSESFGSSSLSSKPTVRADGSLQKMEAFFKPADQDLALRSLSVNTEPATVPLPEDDLGHVPSKCACCSSGAFCFEIRKRKHDNMVEASSAVAASAVAVDSAEQLRYDLDSVRSLLREVELNCDSTLRAMFASCVFVGVVDTSHSLVQLESQLMLVNHTQALRQMCYQLCLLKFGGMRSRALNPPVDVGAFLAAALGSSADSNNVFGGAPNETVAETALGVLMDHRELLSDYFGIQFNSQSQLVGLPEVFPKVLPCLNSLPFFLRDLAMETEWTDETSCIRSVCRLIAKFFTSLPLEFPTGMNLHLALETILYPLFRRHLKLGRQQPFTCFPVTDLNSLYKVFERC